MDLPGGAPARDFPPVARTLHWLVQPSHAEEEMAYKIIASQCTGCSACEFECPNAAISMKGDTFIIDPAKCTECEGHYDHAQCDTVCPVPKTCVPA
jgi:ferredoxin